MRQVGWHTIVSFAELLFPLVECLPHHALASGEEDTVRRIMQCSVQEHSIKQTTKQL